MQYISVGGTDYIHIQSLAEALGVSTATIYNWRRAGHLEFERPLGRALTFVSREAAERIMRLKITDAMGAFLKDMKA